MATSMTRATALSAAIVLLENDHQADAANVLRKMRDSITKPRSKDSSKAALNSRLAGEVADAFRGTGNFQNADVRAVMNGVDWIGSKGVVSPQKVSAVLRQGIADGLIGKEIVGTGKASMTFYRVL